MSKKKSNPLPPNLDKRPTPPPPPPSIPLMSGDRRIILTEEDGPNEVLLEVGSLTQELNACLEIFKVVDQFDCPHAIVRILNTVTGYGKAKIEKLLKKEPETDG